MLVFSFHFSVHRRLPIEWLQLSSLGRLELRVATPTVGKLGSRFCQLWCPRPSVQVIKDFEYRFSKLQKSFWFFYCLSILPTYRLKWWYLSLHFFLDTATCSAFSLGYFERWRSFGRSHNSCSRWETWSPSWCGREEKYIDNANGVCFLWRFICFLRCCFRFELQWSNLERRTTTYVVTCITVISLRESWVYLNEKYV